MGKGSKVCGHKDTIVLQPISLYCFTTGLTSHESTRKLFNNMPPTVSKAGKDIII